MSGCVSAMSCDWSELLKNKDKLRGKQGGRWFLDAEDNSESWVERADNWRSDSHPWTDAALEYDDLRKDLDETTRQLFDRLFGTFFIGKHGGCERVVVSDLDAGELDQDVFYATMSPSTTQQYAALASALSFDSLRAAFEENCGSGFDSFCDYMQQWIDLLRNAAERRKGVVVSILF
jgi:hypothetical protein